MVRVNTNKSIKFHSSYFCHRENVHQLRFQRNFIYCLWILLVFLGHLTIKSEMKSTKTRQCFVLSPQRSWRKMGGGRTCHSETWHRLVDRRKLFWSPCSRAVFCMSAAEQIQSDQCRLVAYQHSGQHAGDVPEIPAPFDMIHMRCDSPQLPMPFSPGLHPDLPWTPYLVKSNTNAERWQREEAVIDGCSFTSPYITVNT